jgi:hypothetical protein
MNWKQSDIDKLQPSKIFGNDFGDLSNKELEAMKKSFGQKKSTKNNVKKKALSISALKPISSNALTKAAITYFSAKGFECWRNNNLPAYDLKAKAFRKNTTKKGVSDIIGYNKATGQALFVEIKAGKDKLSIEQTQFLKDAEKANCFVRVIRSVDDLVNFFKGET